jgi:hypothetical protein
VQRSSLIHSLLTRGACAHQFGLHSEQSDAVQAKRQAGTDSSKKKLPLPFSLGRSTGASFSIPVNVQEILAKQPLYVTATENIALAAAATNPATPPAQQQQQQQQQPSQPVASRDSTAAEAVRSGEMERHLAGVTAVISSLQREIDAMQREYRTAMARLASTDPAQTDSAAAADWKMERSLGELLQSIDVRQAQLQVLTGHRHQLIHSLTELRDALQNAKAARRTRRSSRTKRKKSVKRKLRPSSASGRRFIHPLLSDRDPESHHSVPLPFGSLPSSASSTVAGSGGGVTDAAKRLYDKKIHSLRFLADFKRIMDEP